MAAKGNILTQSRKSVEKVRLGDVCSIVYGERIRKKDSVGGAYPVYGGGGETFRWSTFNRENKCVVSRFAMSKECVRFVSGKFFLNDSGLTVETKDDRSLSQWYLDWFLFGNQDKIYSLGQGAAQKNLEISRFINLEIPLPSLPKQKRIAAALDKVCELKKNAEAQIENLDLLVKSRFVEMFGDPVKNDKGFNEIELQEITIKIGSGATPRGGEASYQATGISLIRSMNVHDGRFKYDELAHLSDAQAKELKNVVVMAGDVLLNITGASVARSCIVPNDVLPARVNQHVAIIRPNDKVISLYLNSLFIYPTYKRLLLGIGESGGATRQAITKQQLLTLKLPLPPISLQREFAAFVEKVEKLKDVAKKSVEEMDTLYRAKLQEYFG